MSGDAHDALALIRNRLSHLDSFALYFACISFIDAYPHNPYISLAACEELLTTSHPDLAFSLFYKRYHVFRSLGEYDRLRKLINKLHLLITPADYFYSKIFDLHFVFSDSLLSQKLSQGLFNKSDYSGAVDCLLTIKDTESISYHSVLLLSQSALSLDSPYVYRVIFYLDQLYMQSGRLDVLSNIMLLCFSTNEGSLILTYWNHIDLCFIYHWQMMIWFNRLLPPQSLEHDVVSHIKIQLDFSCPSLSSSLVFQYLIVLVRHSEVLFCRNLLSHLPHKVFLNPHLKCLSVGLNSPMLDGVSSVWSDRCVPIQVLSRNSKFPVLVFFSGLTGAYGHYPFHLLCALFSDIPVNIVVLQDPTQHFFSKGLIGFGSCVQESSQLLIDYLGTISTTSIIYVGDSLSGLAALNFALCTPPTAVLSLAGVLSVNDYSDFDHKFSTDISSDLFVNPSSYDGFEEPLAQGHYAIIRAEKVRNLFPPLSTSITQLPQPFQLHYVYCIGNKSDRFTYTLLSNYFRLHEHCITDSSTHFIANLSIACNFYTELFLNLLSSVLAENLQSTSSHYYKGCEPQDLL